MALDTRKYDDIFKRAVEKQRWSGQMMMILKGIVMQESTFQPRGYRYEPAFFKILIKKEPWWADKDPAIVSASYGLSQILFTTAWALGMKPTNWKSMNHNAFQGLAENLYDPEVNVGYEAKLLRMLIDSVWKESVPIKFEHLSAVDVALARYNGGTKKYLPGGAIVDKNPDKNGLLDQQGYVDKVWRRIAEIKKLEAS